jgi:hypothetical protein
MAKWVLGGLLLIMALVLMGTVCSVCGNVNRVVQKEFYPNALLRKYEWFKDASASLDKKIADIEVYSSRFQALESSYAGQPRTAWAREDREQWAVWQSEVAGVKASYNGLAAEYNAQMVKFNWRFTNVGDLPPGSTMPLPREYKPYVEK